MWIFLRNEVRDGHWLTLAGNRSRGLPLRGGGQALARRPVTGYATALKSISVGVNHLAGMARALIAIWRTAQYDRAAQQVLLLRPRSRDGARSGGSGRTLDGL